jgi:cell wall-associated NlpC family hydrolase
MTEIADYIDALIEQPWTPERHCWHLVRQVYAELLGVDLPIVSEALPVPAAERYHVSRRLLASDEERARWREIERPQPFALVGMHSPGSRPQDLQHVGVYLVTPDGEGVLHTDLPHGVAFDSLAELLTLRRWIARFFLRN